MILSSSHCGSSKVGSDASLSTTVFAEKAGRCIAAYFTFAARSEATARQHFTVGIAPCCKPEAYVWSLNFDSVQCPCIALKTGFALKAGRCIATCFRLAARSKATMNCSRTVALWPAVYLKPVALQQQAFQAQRCGAEACIRMESVGTACCQASSSTKWLWHRRYSVMARFSPGFDLASIDLSHFGGKYEPKCLDPSITTN